MNRYGTMNMYANSNRTVLVLDHITLESTLPRKWYGNCSLFKFENSNKRIALEYLKQKNLY